MARYSKAHYQRVSSPADTAASIADAVRRTEIARRVQQETVAKLEGRDLTDQATVAELLAWQKARFAELEQEVTR
jgi:hypothetical protein